MFIHLKKEKKFIYRATLIVLQYDELVSRHADHILVLKVQILEAFRWLSLILQNMSESSNLPHVFCCSKLPLV